VSRADPGTVLITGGAAGLGAAIVGAVASAGGNPLVLDINPPVSGVDHERVDLADPRGAEAATRAIIERAGGVDGVVTAAGIDACGPLSEIPSEDWERVVNVNLLSSVAVIRACLDSLVERRGRVVTVASTLGWRALPDASAYCASKFGVVGFTRALALEMGDRIGVTLLIPGGMRTTFFNGRPEKYKPPPEADLLAPGDVAAAVVFALTRPVGVELRELVVSSSTETSWP
jgi:NAD(P)-dependent dehydrogenase (short-subunit alcohol dehydrogenase family)